MPFVVALVVAVVASGLHLMAPVPAAAAVPPVPTTTSLSSSSPASVFGQRVTLTAVVKGGAPAPVGTVTFTLGSTVLGTATTYFGKHTMALSSLPVGSHQIAATFASAGSHEASTTAITQVVAPALTSIAVTASPTAPVNGQLVTLTAVVSTVAPGAGTPFGMVTFTERGTTLGTAVPWFGRYSVVVRGWTAGRHDVVASFAATGTHAASTQSFIQTVDAAATVVIAHASANPTTAGAGVELVATVGALAPGSGLPPGTVTFSEGDAVLGRANLFFNRYVVRLPSLPTGAHPITATYDGSSAFAGSAASFILNVVLPRPLLSVTASTVTPVAGERVTLEVTVADATGGLAGHPTGAVSVTEGELTVATGEVHDGRAQLDLGARPLGSHDLAVTYGGDAVYGPVTEALTIEVVPAVSSIALVPSVARAVLGEPVTFTATVMPAEPAAGPATGSVELVADGEVLGVGEVDAAGRASFAAPPWTVGSYELTATYTGDARLRSSTTSLTHDTRHASSALHVEMSASPAVIDHPVDLTVAVAAVAPGAGHPTGTVVVRDTTAGADVVVGSAALDEATARITLAPLSVGDHELTVTYAGDGGFLPTSTALDYAVVKEPAVVAVTSTGGPSIYGDPADLVIDVSSEAGHETVPGGSVLLAEGDLVLAEATLVGGTATIRLPALVVGDHALTVRYGGDEVFAPATAVIVHEVFGAPATLTVVLDAAAGAPPDRSAVSVWSAPTTFTLTVTPVALSQTPSGSVELAEGGTARASVALVDGTAQISLPTLSVGEHVLTASYAGDGVYGARDTVIVHTVVAGSTTMSLTSSASTAVFGQPVTLTAIALAAPPATGAPGGSVRFVDGEELLATVPLDDDGAAALTLPSRAVGSHPITAELAGDESFATNHASLVQAVVPAATTTAIVAAETPVIGQPLVATVSVRSHLPSLAVASGTVTLMDGSVAVGDLPVGEDGVVTVSVPTSAVGARTLTVSFAGASFEPSFVVMPFQVLPSPTTTHLTGVPAAPVFGRPFTISAAVSRATSTTMPAQGSVNLFDGTTLLGTFDLVDGVATHTIDKLTTGSHEVRAVYLGTSEHTMSSGSLLVPVLTPTAVGVTTTANPVPYGSVVWVAASVTATDPTITPTGTVTFADGAVTLGASVLSGGTAMLRLPVPDVRLHEVSVTYAGDAASLPSQGTLDVMVDHVATSTKVVSDAEPYTSGRPGSLLATVTLPDRSPAEAGTVTFTEGQTTLGTASVFFGRYGLPLNTLGVGLHTITVRYAGTARHAPSTTIITQTVHPAATTVSLSTPANPADAFAVGNLQATVTAMPTGAAAFGTVTFSEGGLVLRTTSAFFGRYNLPLSDLGVGVHLITATFTGSRFLPSSATITQVVVRAVPKLVLSTSRNPSRARDGTFLTVTVTAASGRIHPMSGPQRQGAVTFMRDGVIVGSALVDGNRAHLSTLDLPPGAHGVVARYSGNESYLPVDSAPLIQTIELENPVPSVATATELLTDRSCLAAVGIGDSRLMNAAMTGRASQIALGLNSPLDNEPILGQAPKLQAIMGYRYGSFAHLEFIKTQKARCPGARRYFTVLGPNHVLHPTYLAGDTSDWDATDTAELHAVLDLMSGDDRFGPGGTVAVASFVFSPNAPTWGRAAAEAHDHAVREYAAAHPDRTVRLLDLDPKTVSWFGGDDWYHPTTSPTAVGPATGQDELAKQVFERLAAHEPALAALRTTTTITAPSRVAYDSGASITASVRSAAPATGTPQGTVRLLAGTETIATTALPATGDVSWPPGELPVGRHHLTARFDSSGGSFPSTSTSIELVVEPAATAVALGAPSSSALTATIVLQAAVRSADPAGGEPRGVVTFRDGDRDLGSATLDEGEASLAVTGLVIGDHLLIADYRAAAGYLSSSTSVPLTVTREPTSITAIPSDPVLRIADGAYLVAVVSTTPSAPHPTGTVQLLEDGDVVAEGRTAFGRAFLSLTDLPPGEHTVTVAYEGNAWNAPSSTVAGFVLASTADRTDRCTAPLVLGDERLLASVRFGRFRAISVGGDSSPFMNDPLLAAPPIVHARSGARAGDVGTLDAIGQHRAACPGAATTFAVHLDPVPTPPDADADADPDPVAGQLSDLDRLLDEATAPDGSGVTGRVLIVSGPAPVDAVGDLAATERDAAVEDYIARHPDREVHLLRITAAELDPRGVASRRATADGPGGPPATSDELSFRIIVGLAGAFPDLAVPPSEWLGNIEGERIVVYGDSLSEISSTALAAALEPAHRTRIVARGGFRYDQLLDLMDKVQAGAGAPRRGDIVVVEGGSNDAIQAALGNWDLSRSPLFGARFIEDNPQARCFVYVTSAAYTPYPEVNRNSAVLNEWIRGLALTDSRVRIADWDDLVRQHRAAGEPDGPILAADQLHPNPQGQQQFADLVASTAATCVPR